MKILVIDDNPVHQQSARQTLNGHDLTVVGSYDEAFELLQRPLETIRSETFAAMERDRFQFPGKDASMEENIAANRHFCRQMHKVIIPNPRFDVVLTDLLMPASKRVMAGDGLKYVGQEMSVGFGLLLMAVQCGARFAAVVTDTDHHKHPASAMLDPFASICPHEYNSYGEPPRFTMNGTIVGFYQAPLNEDGSKNWGRVLQHLLEN